MTQPVTTIERQIMTMFWNKSKFDDQNRICSNMKIAQQIPATSVATIGMNGLASFFVITTRFIV
jgi:predicted transcriptional regulator